MDFTIEIDNAAATADMTFVPATTILNNIYISLTIVRGSWWFNTEFGLRNTRRLKNTERNARLVKDWIKEALQWLIDSGRATSIEITIQRDRLQNPTRLLALIEAHEADGNIVTFEKFVEVV